MEVLGDAQGTSEEPQPPDETASNGARSTASLSETRSHHSLNDILRWPSASMKRSADSSRGTHESPPPSRLSSGHDLPGTRPSNGSLEDLRPMPEDVPLPVSRASTQSEGFDRLDRPYQETRWETQGHDQTAEEIDQYGTSFQPPTENQQDFKTASYDQCRHD